MHASLDRMLPVVFGSRYSKEHNISKEVRWLITQKCLEAYTFENLEEKWQQFLGACLYSDGIKDINTLRYPPIKSGLSQEQIRAINSHLNKDVDINNLIADEDRALIKNAFSIQKTITNQKQFPSVDFLPIDEFEEIGTVGGDTLLLIGREQGSNAPIVARDDNEEIFAIPLYALLNSQEPIKITQDI